MLYIVLGFFVLIILTILVFMRWPTPRTFLYAYNLQGPKGWPILGIGSELALLKDHEILDYLRELLARFPRYVTIWILGSPTVFLREPEDVEVAMGNVLHIQKGIEYDGLMPWLKEGLLTSTGNKWHTRRKMLTPAFHFKILEDNLHSFNRNAILLAEKLLEAKDKPIDIESYARLCTLDVICESVMGVTLGAQNNEAVEYVEAIKRIAEIVTKRQLCFWLFKDWMFHINPVGFEFRKILSFLHNFSDKVIHERRKSFVPNKLQTDDMDLNIKTRRAFLDIMIEYEANNPNSLSKFDIREEVDTVMFEGHDTTSSAVTFTIFMLALHQEVQKKVVAELFDIFGESDRSVEMKDLPKMTYMEKVIKETLRLFPSVPYTSRTLTSDLKLDGNVTIPAGVNLVIMPYFIHRNSRFFPEPEKFDPDRFSERSSQKSVHPYAYIPFSAGPRNCIGQKFAMMELKVIISTVLRRVHLESLTIMEEIKLLPFLILRSHIPILIKASTREYLP